MFLLCVSKNYFFKLIIILLNFYPIKSDNNFYNKLGKNLVDILNNFILILLHFEFLSSSFTKLRSILVTLSTANRATIFVN